MTHPIPLKEYEVQAILREHNPKTRMMRLIKPQPDAGVDIEMMSNLREPGDRPFQYNAMTVGEGYDTHFYTSPFGVPGDLLWCRETFYIDLEDYIKVKLPKEKPSDFDDDYLYYRADGTCCQQIPECQCATEGKTQWKPSIHMPRWASRITLKVLDVQAVRLQDINYNEMKAEGCLPSSICGGERQVLLDDYFIPLWDSICKDKGFGWDTNPWCFACDFERVVG